MIVKKTAYMAFCLGFACVADSGDSIAHGSWDAGRATCKIGEQCTIF